MVVEGGRLLALKYENSNMDGRHVFSVIMPRTIMALFDMIFPQMPRRSVGPDGVMYPLLKIACHRGRQIGSTPIYLCIVFPGTRCQAENKLHCAICHLDGGVPD